MQVISIKRAAGMERTVVTFDVAPASDQWDVQQTEISVSVKRADSVDAEIQDARSGLVLWARQLEKNAHAKGS